MTTTDEQQCQQRISTLVDQLHSVTERAAVLITGLPAFTLSPDAITPSSPASPSDITPTLDFIITSLHDELSSAASPPSAFSVLLSRLVYWLPLPSTSSLFRSTIVRLLSDVLQLPSPSQPSTTPYPSLIAPHLYRLTSLLLPSISFSTQVATSLSTLLSSLLPLRVLPRATLSNCLKLIDSSREEAEKKASRRTSAVEQAREDNDGVTAYFAAGGEARYGQAEAGAAALTDEVEVWEGRRRKRITFEGEAAATFIPIVTSEEEEKRSTAAIEAIRAEQKKEQAEAKLRPEGTTDEDEWRTMWREFNEEADREESEEVEEEEGMGKEQRVRRRFWTHWLDCSDWVPFLPSSQTEAPVSPATKRQRLGKEREREEKEKFRMEEATKEAERMRRVQEEEMQQQQHQSHAQPITLPSPSGFKSTFLFPPFPSPSPSPPPVPSAQFVHPSRFMATGGPGMGGRGGQGRGGGFVPVGPAGDYRGSGRGGGGRGRGVGRGYHPPFIPQR